MKKVEWLAQFCLLRVFELGPATISAPGACAYVSKPDDAKLSDVHLGMEAPKITKAGN